MKNIIIRLIELPLTVHAFTMPDEQGDYNIYLNSSLSAEQQKKSLQHECRHIEKDDFYKELHVKLIESGL